MGKIKQKGMWMVKDGEDYDELVKFRLHFSRCTNRDIAPLKTPNKITIKLQNVPVDQPYHRLLITNY